jgi:hypothetical protein
MRRRNFQVDIKLEAKRKAEAAAAEESAAKKKKAAPGNESVKKEDLVIY